MTRITSRDRPSGSYDGNFCDSSKQIQDGWRISKEDLKEAWEDTKSGLEYAINFLRAEGIDKLSFLSSPFLLVPIAVYWVLKNGEAITETERKRLLRWFYLAHMRGHDSMGSSESILDADLSTLFRTRDLHELTQLLFLHVKKFVVDYDDLNNRGIRSPFFSMLYFVLKQNGVRDWWFGSQTVRATHGKRAHNPIPPYLS